MTAILGRPVRCLANRSTNRFASVADIAICQLGSPNRRVSSSPTHNASSDGSMVVMPVRARSEMASAICGSPWPVIAPVSPRHRSTYSMPSTSVSRAPVAWSKNNGNAPGHRVIQDIGTPPSRDCLALFASVAERGCFLMNRLSSVARRAANRARSIMKSI